MISPTEPFPIKALGTVSALPERHGADILVIGKGTRVGVQRKKFPDDFLTSLADGRLYEQVHLMASLPKTILVVEGLGHWTTDGELVDYRAFTKTQMYALFFSLAFEFGMEVIQVRDINETMVLLTTLDSWVKKAKHQSLRTRPGPKADGWGRRGNREYAMHLLMSFPGVGPELAGRMVDHFGRAPIKWEIGMDEMTKVPGIGKEKAKKMWEALK